MSGRAGRRGKDDKGIAIMMVDEDLDEETCRHVGEGRERTQKYVGCVTNTESIACL